MCCEIKRSILQSKRHYTSSSFEPQKRAKSSIDCTWETLSDDIYIESTTKLLECEKLTEEMVLDRAMSSTRKECYIIVIS